MSSQKRIIVIGGGIVGASVAWHLVRQGAAVTIVASDIGGTATRDSFAWLNATWRNTRSYYEFRRLSMEAWKRLVQELPDLNDVVKWCGSIQWDMADEELARFEKEHKAWGYDITRVGKDEIHAHEPHLSADVLPDWGLKIGEEGTVEASDAASMLIKDARSRGAELVLATISSLLKEDGRVKGVVLANGEKVWGDHVVCAAGTASTHLCATAGVELPVSSRAGLLVHSKPMKERLLHGLVLSPEIHMRQTVLEGSIVAGAGFVGSDPGQDPAKTAAKLFDIVKRMFKDGNALEQDFFTVGIRPMPSDGLPILGSTGVEGLNVAVMHSGVTLAAIVGEIIADELVHGKENSAFQQYGLNRFR